MSIISTATIPVLHFDHKDVALVASSSSLLNEELGSEIDKFNTVIRFNGAPTIGYEKYVGSKTTIRVMNHATLRRAKNLREMKNSKFLIYTGDTWDKKKPAFLDPSIDFYYMKPQPLDYEDVGAPLRTGMMMTQLCVQAGLIPHLFGFDIKTTYTGSHYWEERRVGATAHNGVFESKVYCRMLKEGRIVEGGSCG